MSPRHHGDDSSWVRHQGRAIHRMLEHGARPHEGTVLFGPVHAEPAMDERLHPGSFAAREDDGPVRRRWVLLIHDAPSTGFGSPRVEVLSSRVRFNLLLMDHALFNETSRS